MVTPVESVGQPDRRHNPLIAQASFGWLPEVITGVEYGVGRHGDNVVAVGRGQFPPMICLTVYDEEPPLDRLGNMGGKPVAIPTKVGEHDGYWISIDPGDPLNGGSVLLRWPAGGDRWAEIYAYYLDVREPAQMLLRVAADVRTVAHAVPLPLHISSVPDNFRIGDVVTTRRPDCSDTEWSVEFFYTVNGSNVYISVKPEGGEPPRQAGAVCKTENGLTACVAVERPIAADLDYLGGVQGLLDRITLLGPDEDSWTVQVIG
ncbi:hypothetical protein [Prauserella cavernicola]|uniref:Uncharacterized protein n=1 Tax=Prauserella cavernicola TaxID=2800127 RepID=A0A934QSU3_9PSEU|nr:hypothetical protein [Prauserella cavernicola]MBK1785596.1 hypothetical protein [Prauserella cavernicola]